MKQPLAALFLFCAGAAVVVAQSPASGVAPAGTPTPHANTKVYRTPGAHATNSAAANQDVSNGRGRIDENAPPSADSVSTERPPDIGSPDTIGVGAGQPAKVLSPPPDDMLDIRPPPPGPDQAWVGGHWVWRVNRWDWVAGRWVRPPRPGLTWYSPTYDAHTQTWNDGYWGPDPTPEASAPMPGAPLNPRPRSRR